MNDRTTQWDQVPGLTADEKTFVEDLCNRFPRVAEGYRHFTNAEPMFRLREAMQGLQKQPRTGWLLRFPDLPQEASRILDYEFLPPEERPVFINSEAKNTVETVLQHSSEAAELFGIIYAKHPWHHKQWGTECMKFHDFHEAIDGDFTPHCAIERHEKKRLEGISTRLLCSGKEHGDLLARHVNHILDMHEGRIENVAEMKKEMLTQISNDRENGRGPRTLDFFDKLYRMTPEDFDTDLLAQQTADMDVLHMAVRACRMVKEGHIPVSQANKLEGMWDYTEGKLQTPEAKEFFETFRQAYRDEDVSYKVALEAAARSAHSISGPMR